MNKEIIQKLDRIIELLENKKSSESRLEFEPHNFRVNSDNWKKITVNEKEYLENPEKDVWELNDGELKGEQLFTWDAAIRETKKARKRMPTDEEFTELLKIKSDMPNVVFAGYSYSGSFDYLGSDGYFWSSVQSGADAWYRGLDSGYAQVGRDTDAKTYGLSVRCLKN